MTARPPRSRRLFVVVRRKKTLLITGRTSCLDVCQTGDSAALHSYVRATHLGVMQSTSVTTAHFLVSFMASVSVLYVNHIKVLSFFHRLHNWQRRCLEAAKTAVTSRTHLSCVAVQTRTGEVEQLFANSYRAVTSPAMGYLGTCPSTSFATLCMMYNYNTSE